MTTTETHHTAEVAAFADDLEATARSAQQQATVALSKRLRLLAEGLEIEQRLLTLWHEALALEPLWQPLVAQVVSWTETATPDGATDDEPAQRQRVRDLAQCADHLCRLNTLVCGQVGEYMTAVTGALAFTVEEIDARAAALTAARDADLARASSTAPRV